MGYFSKGKEFPEFTVIKKSLDRSVQKFKKHRIIIFGST